MTEHQVIRKSHDAIQKKCPHEVHIKVPCDWFEANSQNQKHHSDGRKKICGCHSLLGRVVEPGVIFQAWNCTVLSGCGIF